MSHNIKPLVDTDILLYEIGFSSEQVDEETGDTVPSSWDFCVDLLEKRINLICEEVEADQPPLLFLTNSKYLNKLLNKQRKREDEPLVDYVDNFRNTSSVQKEYKGNRKQKKPFHYKNLLNHILANYKTYVAENGLEADDALCVHQYTRWKEGHKDTIICSRDKDLRQCPGWHYSWEVGKQAAIGPLEVDEFGWLEKTGQKVFGVGNKFFYYQMVTGDPVDNIIGIRGKGPAFAFKLLNEAETERQCYELVAELYVKTYEDEWEKYWEEMSDLLWMVRELDEEGNKIGWQKPPI